MKKALLFSALFFLIMSGMAHASLTTIGTVTYYYIDYNYKDCTEFNLIWDDDNNGNSVVWLDYSNLGDWDSQVAWVSGLNGDGVLTYNIDARYSVIWDGDWRLPATVDGYMVIKPDGTGTGGFNVTSSEMGHLFFAELDNLAYYNTSGIAQSGYGLTNAGDFKNLYNSRYWSGTEYTGTPGTSWYFDMINGYQTHLYQYFNRYGLALRSGQVSAVPVPGAVWLLGSGLLGLAGIRRRTKS
ncbi:MAG: VPLPA-CTERM sorting domain-containing protein [Desulfobacteraceae bacterium]